MIADPIVKVSYPEMQKKQIQLSIARASDVFKLSQDGEIVKRLNKNTYDKDAAYFLRRSTQVGMVNILDLLVPEKPTSKGDAKKKLLEIIGETDPDFTKLIENGEIKIEPKDHNGEPVIQVSRILPKEDEIV